MKKIIKTIIATSALAVFLGACGAQTTTVHKEYVQANNEVTKIGPYSQMIRSNGFLFCSAQVAFDPTTGELIEGDISAQTKQVLSNFEAEAKDAGLTMKDAVEVTVYLANMDDFTAMNDEYAKHFEEPYPVRACVEVSKIPVEGALVSIEMTFADNQ